MKRFIPLITLILVLQQSYSQDRFWVNGTGNWGDQQHWSLTSGGAPGASVPTADDNVWFDQNSFTSRGQEVIIKGKTVHCQNFNWLNTNQKPVLTGKKRAEIHISGSMNIEENFENLFTGNIIFEAEGPVELSSQTAFQSNFILQKESIILQLSSDIKTSGNFIVSAGTFNSNNYDLECNEFISTGENQRAIDLTSSEIRAEKYSVLDGENFRFNAGSSEILLKNNQENALEIDGEFINKAGTDGGGGKAAVTFNLSADSASCHINNDGPSEDGAITVTMITGDAPFTYQLRDADFIIITTYGPTEDVAHTFTGLEAASYGIRVIDNEGDRDNDFINVYSPDELSLVMDNTQPITCYGGSDGEICADVSGGTAPYDYLWNYPTPPATTQCISPLGIGNYTCVVTDSKGCSDGGGFLLLPPAQLNATISGDATICNDGTTTNLQIDFEGVAPYDIVIQRDGGNDDPVTTSDNPYFHAVSEAGTYTLLSFEDDEGCVGATNGSATVSHYPIPDATISGGGTICDDGSTANLIITFNAGTAPFDFELLRDGGNNVAYTNISDNPYTIPQSTDGTYTIDNLVDDHGCPGTIGGTAIIDYFLTPSATIAGSGTVCDDGSTFGLTVDFTGTAPFSITYLCDGGNPQTITGINDDPYTLNVPCGCTYTLQSMSDANCPGTVAGSGTVDCHDTPAGTIAGGGDICNDGSTADLVITFTAGTAPFSFDILRDGNPYLTRAGIVANPYTEPVSDDGTFTITNFVDTYSCPGTITGSADVNYIASPSAEISGDAIICDGESTNITITFPTGTAPFAFSWTRSGNALPDETDVNENPYTISVSDSGTYVLTAVSDVNCSGSVSGDAEIEFYETPTATISGDANICDGEPTTLSVTLTGSWPWDFTVLKDGAPYQTFNDVAISPKTFNVSTCGVYTLGTVSDFNCDGTVAGSATVTCFPDPTAVFDDALVQICNDGGNASLDMTFTGTPPFNVSICRNGGDADDIVVNALTYTYLTPLNGTYSICALSDVNCSNTSSSTCVVEYLESPVAEISGDTTICDDGVATAPIRIDFTEGTAPFEIVILRDGGNPTTHSNINDNPYFIPVSTSGVYTLQSVEDINCTGLVSGSATVQYFPIPQAAIAGGGTICADEFADLTITLTTGTTPFTFTLYKDGIPGDEHTANSSPYTVLVNETGAYTIDDLGDNNGCEGTTSGSANVFVNSLPTGSISGDATICNGESTNLTFTFTGTQPFSVTYTRSGQDPATINGINAFTKIEPVTDSGTYVITEVGGGNGCTNTGTGSAYVQFFETPVATISGGATICDDGSTAELSVAFTGTGPWTFTLQRDGANDVVYANKTQNPYTIDTTDAGTYTVTDVSDANCDGTGAGSAVIDYFDNPSADISGDAAICDGTSTDLTIDFEGTGPWTIDITKDGAPFADDVTTSDDPFTYSVDEAGVYALSSVSDANCNGTTTGIATITIIPLPTAAISPANTTICAGESATLDVNLTGTANWEVEIYKDGASFATYSDIALPFYQFDVTESGVYTVETVTDANCSDTGDGSTATVVVNELPTAAIITGDTTICNGDSAMVIVQLTGVSPWSYRYTDGVAPVNVTGVTATVDTFYISESGSYALNYVEDANCIGNANGNVNITIDDISASIGAPSPFTIAASTRITLSFTGTHELVQDLGFYLLAPDGVTTVELKSSPSEGGGFLLCNFGSDFTDLVFSNDPLLTIDDTLPLCVDPAFPGSTLTGTYSITGDWSAIYGMDPAQGGWALMIKDCSPGQTGTLTEANISFRDQDGEGDFVTVAYESGDISYPIKDAVLACGETKYQVPIGLNVSCYGDCDAVALVSVVGGVEDFTYDWSDGELPANDSVNLCAGTYYVTVTDDLGCKAVDSVTVIEPDSITINVTNVTDPVCFGEFGTATVSAAGDFPPFEYFWDNGEEGVTADSLLAGDRSVTVRDANGCERIKTIPISQPDSMELTVTTTPPSVCGGDDGKITIVVDVGTTPPYTYSIDSANTFFPNGGIFTDLEVGVYDIAVKDAFDCIHFHGRDTVSEPTDLVIDSVLFTDIAGCYGDSTGTITVYAVNGTGTLQYSVDSGATFFNNAGLFEELRAGDYFIQVQDDFCTIAYGDTVTLEQPDSLYFSSILISNVTTCGGNDGEITITAAGGTGVTYTYSLLIGEEIVENQTGEFTGLESGNYTIGIQDENGCTRDSLVTVDELANPIIIDSVHVTHNTTGCYGDSIGAIVVFATGGINQQYSILNGIEGSYQTDSNFVDLPAADYQIVVKDDNNCTKFLDSVITLTQPQELLIDSLDITQITACGADDGSITVYASGGTLPLRYTLDEGEAQSDSIFQDLGPATYNVMVQDTNDCEATYENIIISDPATLEIDTVTATDATTCGGTDGTVTVLLVEDTGNPPFTYYLYGADTVSNNTGAFTDRPVGTYTVAVEDALTCLVNYPYDIEIGEPDGIDTIIMSSNPSNFGELGDECTGSATANPIGAFPFEFLWNTMETTATIQGLCVETYSVTVTDANECVDSAEVEVDTAEYSLVIDSLSVVDCESDCNGYARVHAEGGSGQFNYEWSTGTEDSVATNLCGGVNYVTVYDAVLTSNFFVNEIYMTYSDSIQGYFETDSALCASTPTGSATFYVTTEESSLTFYWEDASSSEIEGTQTDTSGTISQLDAGIYYLTVTDDNGCETYESVTVYEPAALTASIPEDSIVHVDCYGDNSGSFMIDPEGGTPPYTYVVNGQDPVTDSVISGLYAGTYSVIVYDANDCSYEIPEIEINQNDSIYIDNIDLTPAGCGDANGEITVSIDGGTPPYEYAWSRGLEEDTLATLSNVAAGFYTVTVTDTLECVFVSEEIQLEDSSDMVVTVTELVSVTCPGVNDGSAIAEVEGGTPDYDFLWSDDPATTEATITDLYADSTYYVSVTDAEGCQGFGQITMSSSEVLSIEISSTNIQCEGEENGTAMVNASGGIPEYTYQWENSTGDDYGNETEITGLPADTYFVTVTDDNECEVTGSVIISEPEPFMAQIDSVLNPLCNGDGNGGIIINITGATVPYTLEFSNGYDDVTYDTLNTYLGFVNGSYSVTITDYYECGQPIFKYFNIEEPTAMYFEEVVIDSTECSDSTGSITVAVGGGTETGEYEYSWFNENVDITDSLGNSITNLWVDFYSLTVTDDNGCELTEVFRIDDDGGIQTEITDIQHVSCADSCNGMATVSATGGPTGDYTYQWNTDPVQTENIATDLCDGFYVVTVTDDECMRVDSVTINEDDVLQIISLSATPILCNGYNSDTVILVLAGGIKPYTVVISDGINPDLTIPDINEDTLLVTDQIAAGNYTVNIYDAEACNVTTTLNLTEPPLLTAFFDNPTVQINCFGDLLDSVEVQQSGGTAPYTYNWDDDIDKWTFDDSVAYDLSTGNYYATVFDANNCFANAMVTILGPENPLVIDNIDATLTYCAQDSGSATVTASGGTPYTGDIYNYQWHNDAWTIDSTTQTITGLGVGFYFVTVTDSLNCTVDSLVAIADTSSLAIAIDSITHLLCPDVCSGSAYAAIIDSTVLDTTYNFWWSNGDTAATADSLCAEWYYVMVTDTAGCARVDSVTITEEDVLRISAIEMTAPECGGDENGSITVTATGGVYNDSIKYTYIWQDELGGTPDFTVSEDSTQSTATGLAGGTYYVTVVNDHDFVCEVDTAIVLYAPDSVKANIVVDHISCNGDGDGSLEALGYGGYGELSYQWYSDLLPDTAYTALIEELAEGRYYLTVTDENECSYVDSADIAEPSLISMVIDTDVSECQGYTGAITIIKVFGGTPYEEAPPDNYNYQFHLDGWTQDSTGSNSITNIGAGFYDVIVSDANGCTADSIVEVLDEGEILFNFKDDSTTHVTCLDRCDGRAMIDSLNIFNVDGPASFTIFDVLWETIPNDTNYVSNQLCLGRNWVTLTDTAGCSRSKYVDIFGFDALSANIEVDDNEICAAENNGRIYVVPINGTLPYSNYGIQNSSAEDVDFTWDGNGYISTGLGPDAYTIQFEDATLCLVDTTVYLDNLAELHADIAITDEICYQDSNGVAIVTVDVEGYNEYEFDYEWSHDPEVNTDSVGDLTAGTYTVTVKYSDVEACWFDTTFTMGGPEDSITFGWGWNGEIYCNDSLTNVEYSMFGGNAGFTYYWSHPDWTVDSVYTDGPGLEIIENLWIDTFYVSGVDLKGCTLDTFIVIPDTSVMIYGFVIDSIDCIGDNNGSIQIIPQQGAQPFTFDWSTGSSGSTITDLIAGEYSIIITNNHGCQEFDTIQLSDPQALVKNLYQTGVVPCYGGTGTIYAGAVGGNEPYDYELYDLSGNLIDDSTSYLNYIYFHNIPAGSYKLYVNDGNDCPSDTTPATVLDDWDDIVVTDITIVPAECNENSPTGSIIVSGITGGGQSMVLEDFTITWDGGYVGDTIEDLLAGTYNYTVESDSGCVKEFSALVPAEFTIDLDAGGAYIDDPLYPMAYNKDTMICYGDSLLLKLEYAIVPGLLEADIISWSPGYTVMQNGRDTAWVKPIESTDYVVSVVKGNCVSYDTVEVGMFPPAVYQIDYDYNAILAGDSIELTAIQTLGNFSSSTEYIWTVDDFDYPDDSSFVYTPPSDTWVYLTVRQEHLIYDTACYVYDRVFVKVNKEEPAPKGFTPNGDGINEYWLIPDVERYPNMVVQIYNRWGKLVWESTRGYSDPFEGLSSDGKELPLGTYYYVIDFKDDETNRVPETGSIFIIRDR